MTRQEALAYARECRHAKLNNLDRPERPDTVNTVTKLSDIEKSIVTARTTLAALSGPMEMVVDYIAELQTRSPQAVAFLQIADFIWGQIMETETLLTRIK